MSAATKRKATKTLDRSLYYDPTYKKHTRSPGAWTLTILTEAPNGVKFSTTHRNQMVRRRDRAAAVEWAEGVQ